MVRPNSLLPLLSFHLTLAFPGTAAVRETPYAPSVLPRSVQQIGGIQPEAIEPIFASVHYDDKTHVFHALNLFRRLVDRQGTMGEVPEEDLENLLDQINTLHSQVNDLLSSKKAENPPEDRIDDKSENPKPTSEAPPATHGGSHSSQAQSQNIVSSPSAAGPSGLDLTTTRGKDQAEQTSVEQSVEKPEGQSATSTQGQSEKFANSQQTLSSNNKAFQHTPQTSSTGLSQELSQETALSVPGGRFKETHTQIAIKTSTAASTASAQETLVGPEVGEPMEQIDNTSGDECPTVDLVARAEVERPMTIMSDPSANTRNTNCTLRTPSADASKHDSTSSSPLGTFMVSPISKSTTSLSRPELVVALTVFSASENSSEVASVLTIPTGAVVSAEEDEPSTFELLRQFRTLVFTSVLMKESTITVTSLHTEVYIVVQTGGTSTDHVSAVKTGPSGTEEEVIQHTGTATPTSTDTDLPVSAGNLVVTSKDNSTLSDGSDLQVATVQESSASVLSHSSDSVTTGGTIIISHLRSFKTLLKPTTSITEAMIEREARM